MEFEHKGTAFDLVGSEIAELQKKLSDYQQALKSTYAEVDQAKLKEARNCEAEGKFLMAQTIYRELIALREGRPRLDAGRAHDIAILDVKYKLAEVQLRRKKYDEAENIARDVWVKRMGVLGEDSADTRLSLL
jgi:tetratricopeptide (TPR) repeat protein